MRGPAPRFVVANGDEGDPGSFCDRLLLESDPHRVLEGLAPAGFAVGANRGVVFVRSEYPVAVGRMQAAVEAARAAGHFGAGVHGSSFDFDVEIVEGSRTSWFSFGGAKGGVNFARNWRSPG
ncbi:hypothetical protein [Saccharopolyspora hattusasensis]|uniref:hypothetical protein n=1 Tax=Saccharopolyspora hattusasensis TaxID=1128679 RepID=UPI003D969275